MSKWLKTQSKDFFEEKMGTLFSRMKIMLKIKQTFLSWEKCKSLYCKIIYIYIYIYIYILKQCWFSLTCNDDVLFLSYSYQLIQKWNNVAKNSDTSTNSRPVETTCCVCKLHSNPYTLIRNYNPYKHMLTHSQPHAKNPTKSQRFLTVFFQFSIHFIFLTAWWLLFCKKLLKT